MMSLEEAKKEHILSVYKEMKFNKLQTAHILGISQRGLYLLLEKYGVHTKKSPK